MNVVTETSTAFRISDSAVKRIAALIGDGADSTRMFRIAVSGGGCSGFQYGFSFDEILEEDDTVFEVNGVRVVVDSASLPFLTGAQLDYVEELIGSYFKVDNPNATSTCGCGSSFAV